IVSSQTFGGTWPRGESWPSTPALARRTSSLPQRWKIAAPRRSIASKSFRSRGTSVAGSPTLRIASSSSSNPPTVRATATTWAPPLGLSQPAAGGGHRHDVGAGGGKAFCRLKADAARGAGDDGDPAGEGFRLVHAVSVTTAR